MDILIRRRHYQLLSDKLALSITHDDGKDTTEIIGDWWQLHNDATEDFFIRGCKRGNEDCIVACLMLAGF